MLDFILNVTAGKIRQSFYQITLTPKLKLLLLIKSSYANILIIIRTKMLLMINLLNKQQLALFI
jgi:hypothetical protein